LQVLPLAEESPTACSSAVHEQAWFFEQPIDTESRTTALLPENGLRSVVADRTIAFGGSTRLPRDEIAPPDEHHAPKSESLFATCPWDRVNESLISIAGKKLLAFHCCKSTARTTTKPLLLLNT
jgi:hypothetical protein